LSYSYPKASLIVLFVLSFMGTTDDWICEIDSSEPRNANFFLYNQQAIILYVLNLEGQLTVELSKDQSMQKSY